MKRAELKPGAGLKRSPWKHRRPPAPAGDMSAPLAMILADGATVAQAARIHGCDPGALELLAWQAARTRALIRDGYRCQYTGGRADDVHHRIPRGMGGTADPAIAFGLANLVSVSRASHALIHEGGAEVRRRGFLLRRGQDPADVPVVTPTPSGLIRAWPTADGRYSYEPPECAA